MNSSIILDLGCGKNKTKNAIGVDKVKLEGVDLVSDLEHFPYPFKDNSIDKIYCSHVLEHFDVNTRNKAIEEMYRILKQDGILELKVPHAFSLGAFVDPTHKSFFIFNTFNYFDSRNEFSYYFKCNFILEKKFAGVNIFDKTIPKNKLLQIINRVSSKILNELFKISDTVPDLIVKCLPFYNVVITVQLRKLK